MTTTPNGNRPPSYLQNMAAPADAHDPDQENGIGDRDYNLLIRFMRRLPIGIFIKDMQQGGRYIVFNEAACALTGKNAGSIIGKADSQIYDPDTARLLRDQDYYVIENNKTLTINDDCTHHAQAHPVRVTKTGLAIRSGETPRYLLGVIEDRSTEQSLQTQLDHTSLHDRLTGLPNRAGLLQFLTQLLKEKQQDFALIFLDIDHFKQINDGTGHAAGDQLLCAIVSRLSALLNPQDYIARFASDEFALIRFLPPQTHDRQQNEQPAAAAFANKIALAFTAPFEINHSHKYVSCTLGIVPVLQAGDTAETLLRNADLALSAAKLNNRGGYRFYNETMLATAEKHHRTVTELHTALHSDEFRLFYQPVFSLNTDEITGCEALLRWQHPIRGLVLPDEFIPAAEDSRLICAIGAQVLKQACRDAMKWPKKIKVSVNLSPVQFGNRNLLETVKSALQESGLQADRLELEITETVLLSDTGYNLNILHELRQLGVSIAMDDFGTGHSSLNYLRTFPFDKIKIDRSFVSDMQGDKRNLAIIQAVVSLGSAFNIITTAEGVETYEQLLQLKNEHFGEVQGFFTGKPMAQADICDFIARYNSGNLRFIAKNKN
ncbi:putative bifunctional diguanylate cyclase/phosphodiesterase [Pseudochrobactrum sp. HB0163]|uniref:putative bifunctional diguanylate cyclase/phosphodiesterase n=1 Tax=Pseudochrobactrum sp. HB0163 TaxID=3450708 RepID=UPI003F6DB1C1